jgi:glycine cleavage system H protein
MNPEDRHYHKEHTWAKVSGTRALIGITDHAQRALGDLVYIELPDIDSSIEAGVEIAEIESTKATASVIAPVSGTITRINDELEDTPEIINESPYEAGWILEVTLTNDSEIDDLMEAAEYRHFVEEEES